MKHIFTDHPHQIGETYWQHMGQAFSFAAVMLGTAFACLVHGLVPCLFETRAKRTIETLHRRIVTHRTPTSRRDNARGADMTPAE